jgi:hypothetical protein
MSDNPLIEGFLKLHEAGGIGGGMSGTKFSKAANYAPAVGAGVRGAVNNITMGAGKYGRAATDYAVKNLGSLAGMSEPTTFDKELEQEKEKDTAAQRDYPAAYDMGDKLATAAQLATGVGAVKVLGKAALKAGLRSAVAKNASQTIAKNADANDFELGMRNALDLTKQMRVPTTPLKLTPNQMIPGSSKITPFPKNTKLTTEDQNESSKGNTEMSINPFIKGFFDIEEARAKNTNIFDESKKLTAAQKKNLDKNDNDKIDAEDFKMLRKKSYNEQATIEEADLSDFKRKSVPGLYNFDHFEHPDGSFIQVSPNGNGVYQDKKGTRKDFTSIQHLKTLFKEEAIDEAKKTNSMVMARNISKVLKAAKPDFLDIDKDGDKEEPMKKAAADKKKENAIDEAQSMSGALKNALSKPEPGSKLHRNIQAHNNSIKNGSKLGDDNHNLMTKAPSGHRFDKKGMIRLGEEVEFSEEEIDFINSVMEAMPVAPTSENDSPNPTPKKKAEGSRAKGSMAD